tara:strand:+ start:1674 stop:3500 length:1827 start_codon:yes stop_codon:yes gene_type:complete
MADKNLNIKVGLKGHKQAEQGLKGVDGAISKMGKAVGIASAAYFGATGLIRGFGKVIELAGRQEQAEAKLNAVLKSTAGVAGLTATELKKMADRLQDVTSFGDEAIIEAQSLLLTFTKVGEDVFPKATETILNMSTAMGQDLQSATIQLGKALNDPVLGISALSRVGVQLTEDQKEQIKSFTELGDIASAQKVILGELETQFGGLARATTETMTGSLDQMGNAVGDAGEALGELLAPMVITTAKGIKTLAEGVGTVITRFKNFGKEVDAVLLDKTVLAQQEIEKFRASIQGLSQEDLKNQLNAMNKANKGMVVYTNTINNQVLMSGQLTKSQELENQKAEVLFERYQELKNILGRTKEEQKKLNQTIEVSGALRKSDSDSIIEVDTVFKEHVESLKAKIQAQREEEGLNARIIAQNPVLASQLGLISKETEKAGYSWDTFNKNLDKAVAGSIATASSISSTSDALGSAGEAAKRSAVTFVSAEIQKAVASYISKFLITTPLPPLISAPLALAGGAAFGSLMSSAIQRNFAEGGIVDGNPSEGDVVPAMLTAGEVILNQAQQENLTGNMGGITLNISAPLVDETIVDTIIPAIQSALGEGRATLTTFGR